MEKYALNDVTYNFKPFEIFTQDSDYNVNKDELEKSIQKSKAIRDKVRESRRNKQVYIQK
ncbi:MAG: hypothetical protein K2N85_14595 [Lachnospiraceae bacterium]|nr:hypothetical protein [Lachnospiraceae bacterium]